MLLVLLLGGEAFGDVRNRNIGRTKTQEMVSICTLHCRFSICSSGTTLLGEALGVCGCSAPNPHLVESSNMPERLELGACMDATASFDALLRDTNPIDLARDFNG